MSENQRLTTSQLRELVNSRSGEAVKKLNSVGKLGGRQKLDAIFDENTFVEIGAYVSRRKTEFDSASDDAFEPVITGYGSVGGRLAFAFSQDFSRMSGALGEMHAKKISALYDAALKSGAPVIGMFDSAGAKVLEGTDALSGYASVMKKVSAAKGLVPQIAIVSGNCSGCSAVIAKLFDIILFDKTSRFYVAPRASENSKLSGFSVDCEDFSSAAEKAKALISMLPSGAGDGTAQIATADDINRTLDGIDAFLSAGYDMRELIKTVFDSGSFFEIGEGFGKPAVCGLASLGGTVVGVAANQPAEKDGLLCPCAAEKLASTVAFCDTFGIPVITLVDCCGLKSTEDEKSSDYADVLASLAFSYASADTPKITVIVGSAYGAGYALMGSKALGADIVLALDGARVSVMAPDAAVAFIESENDASAHFEAAKKWAEDMSTPLAAAKSGDIDDIIAPPEIRQRIAAALAMLTF